MGSAIYAAAQVDVVELVEQVLAVAFWAAGALLFLRFPGRTVGVAAGLTAWTAVGPWAGWTVLGVTLVAAVVYRELGLGDQAGLYGHPVLAAVSLTAAGALLAEGTARRVCVWILAGAVGWVACLWASRWRRVRHLRRELATNGSGRAGGDGRPLGTASMVVIARCQRCDGVLVASGERATDAGEQGVARATCTACGVRYVGVPRPGAADGELVWRELGQADREGAA